jgi:radical SAM superfamily enzyme YgiQ (UPF0313 family)
MKVKMILPALTEARSPYWRPIKYSLFPPLGLLTLAGFLSQDDEIVIQDEHVESLDLDDDPDLVVLQVYITSSSRAYAIADGYRARGIPVAMGGIHPTSRPFEALRHADFVFLGPGEDTWPQFLRDFKNMSTRSIYISKERSLVNVPSPRWDLLKRDLYLVPNSIVASRGCPHSCDFCYKDGFYKGGKSFYTAEAGQILDQIRKMPGRHLYFLDDNLFGNPGFAESLFNGLQDMGRVWQAGGTVAAVMNNDLMEKAARSGLKSMFIGFETLNHANLLKYNKNQNLVKEYRQAIRRLHDLGIMINASFVFGMDDDDNSVFDRTVDWALENGIETATFHILTPYPGTALYERLLKEGRIISTRWDDYDTRHAVFKPSRISPAVLEEGYWRSYKNFYSWSSIFKAAAIKPSIPEKIRHVLYSGGWKKFEFLWTPIIRMKMMRKMRPLLETILAGLSGLKPVKNSHSMPVLVGKPLYE